MDSMQSAQAHKIYCDYIEKFMSNMNLFFSIQYYFKCDVHFKSKCYPEKNKNLLESNLNAKKKRKKYVNDSN